ncbi:hypothetical protein M8J76_006428 [Diaphorina citri]|nr:hypothetical protein M8J75_009127 [Diaphorina citri]KAI5716442.1 hypothetical protein M8J76_006428 [Diaphorina citri]
MKRFSKTSTRNSNKSLSLKSTTLGTPGCERKHESGGAQRSLSMEHINNNSLTSAKSKDLKLNGENLHDNTMISAKISSADLLSLCVQNKQSSTTVLSNIENTLYNGTNFYNSAPNGDSVYKNNSAPNGDSLYRNNSSATNGGDSSYKNNSSAPGGDCTNELDKAEAEARLCKLRQELDRKRIFIKNMKMSLDTVDSSDNIDIRIQHAELEYQLGKEELNLLNILEEFRNLQNSLENNFNKSDSYFHESLSIYNYIVQHCASADTLTLHAVQIPYDSKCPKFGLSYRDENHGLFVEWTSEEGGGSGLCKGDRILEINNHLIVQNNNRTEIIKLLKLLPTTKLVVLRTVKKPAPTTVTSSHPKPDEAEKIQNDNVRLTHRISYLEEQVAELLQKVNKGETFYTSGKISRTKNKYLETSLCSKSYETKEYQSQRKLDSKYDSRPEEDEVQVFQKGNKIKTLLKNQKYAKEKLDKVLERTRKYAKENNEYEARDEERTRKYAAKENMEYGNERDEDQRYPSTTQETDSKENRHSLSRKYKTLDKCNTSKYHRRKKSESNIEAFVTKSNLSDTETYIPKIKSKSLIYLNKSQSDYNYPIAALHGSEKSINSLNPQNETDESLRRLSVEKLDSKKTSLFDDERYRKTYTFPIVKYNSDKNVRKIIDAKIYEESGHGRTLCGDPNKIGLEHGFDRLEDRKDTYSELNRKLGLCSEEDDSYKGKAHSNVDPNDADTKENRTIIRTNNANENSSNTERHGERVGRLYIVDETGHSLNKTSDAENRRNHNHTNDKEFNGVQVNTHPTGTNNDYQYQRPGQNHPYSTSKISIEFMDKNYPLNDTHVKSNRNESDYQKPETNNNELYRIEKAIFNELHEECINKLDKTQDQRITEDKGMEKGSGRSSGCNTDENEECDEYGANQYDEFVRSKQSLDRIYDRYFQEPDDETGGQKDKHRLYNKKDILKNKFKNEKYVDIDNDNEIPLSKNVEKLNNNFKEFWKIKSCKRNSESASKVEKSQSETNFNDYERKMIGNSRVFSTLDDRKFNENTRMSKYELDDKLEKEKLQKAFLNHSRSKPIPPKKPARLSLQRAASLQSVNSIASVMTHNSDSQTKKPIKRNYKGDTTYMTVSLQNAGNERWC